MSKIAPQTIERIKSCTRIVDVIGDFYQLRKKGTEYQCLCPFHKDTHLGSFSISPRKNIYQCFSCGASGDAITFLMKHANMSFPDAIRWLGRKYSIDVDGAASFEIPRAQPKPLAETKLPLLTIPADYVEKRLDTRCNVLCNWIRHSIRWSTEQRERLEETLALYRVGSSKSGMTIFWQIDEEGRVRTGKMMLYKPDGHRDRDRPHNFDWVHSALARAGMYDQKCQEMSTTLFGMHLLRLYPEATVHIVESEKTALLCAIAYGDFERNIWMATGGLSMLGKEKLKPLITDGRTIVLYPDRDGAEKWESKAKSIEYDRLFINTGILADNWKPEDGEKADIADILLRIINGSDRQT